MSTLNDIAIQYLPERSPFQDDILVGWNVPVSVESRRLELILMHEVREDIAAAKRRKALLLKPTDHGFVDVLVEIDLERGGA